MKLEETMDTKTLVVGQEVDIACGYTVYIVQVVEVTPEGGAVVRTIRPPCPPSDRFGNIGFSVGGLLRFDNNGKGYYITETSDCPGPWYLVGSKDWRSMEEAHAAGVRRREANHDGHAKR